jgi:hypothetical protein
MNSIPNWMYLTVAVVLIITVGAVCIWRITAQALVNASEVQVDIINLLTKQAENRNTYGYNGGRERHAQATAATTAD